MASLESEANRIYTELGAIRRQSAALADSSATALERSSRYQRVACASFAAGSIASALVFREPILTAYSAGMATLFGWGGYADMNLASDYRGIAVEDYAIAERLDNRGNL